MEGTDFGLETEHMCTCCICEQIMKMWVFSGTKATFFVFLLFTQPVGNQDD